MHSEQEEENLGMWNMESSRQTRGRTGQMGKLKHGASQWTDRAHNESQVDYKQEHSQVDTNEHKTSSHNWINWEHKHTDRQGNHMCGRVRSRQVDRSELLSRRESGVEFWRTQADLWLAGWRLMTEWGIDSSMSWMWSDGERGAWRSKASAQGHTPVPVTLVLANTPQANMFLLANIIS